MAKKKIKETDLDDGVNSVYEGGPLDTPNPEVLSKTVSTKEQIIEDIIKPAIEDHLREKILALRERGFDNNRIAGTLMIHKHIVDSLV